MYNKFFVSEKFTLMKVKCGIAFDTYCNKLRGWSYDLEQAHAKG